ncbi:MAG: hypothetical protein FJ243_03535 [Nitrospira sp.]|nr:hypothetical protein [Nitrospira sp.]
MVKRIIIIFVTILCVSFLCTPSYCSGKDRVPDYADKVVVIKSKRIMMLLKDGEILKIYKVALGKNPFGHKTRAGDFKTPEGTYILDKRNPNSRFYLSMHISYPNESDRLNAKNNGVSPGDNIMIHGVSKELEHLGRFHRLSDWTNGCVAVSNAEMREIWQLVPDGTTIEIRP